MGVLKKKTETLAHWIPLMKLFQISLYRKKYLFLPIKTWLKSGTKTPTTLFIISIWDMLKGLPEDNRDEFTPFTLVFKSFYLYIGIQCSKLQEIKNYWQILQLFHIPCQILVFKYIFLNSSFTIKITLCRLVLRVWFTDRKTRLNILDACNLNVIQRGY